MREGVQEWRAAGYPGVSATTQQLLLWWFETEHTIASDDGYVPFRWYFAQREAVESAIWLYEHEGARNPYDLMRYDSSGEVSRALFLADWPHYVMKLATGAGKTKVLSLLMAWSYFHALYEEDSPLSTNILLIAPNIIVLDRLQSDFGGEKIFHADPILPENGWNDRDWQADFQLNVHIQDQIGAVSRRGNLFLTNIHRVTDGPKPPSFADEDTTDYFLGPKPVTKTTDSLVDLGLIVRQVDDLIVFNDEAHHMHEKNQWFSSIEDIVLKLRQRGGRFAGQFDVTATPKHNNNTIFANTISDYPLVEAIRQRVVKKPVIPDAASRHAIQEFPSADFVEQFREHIELGVVEWRKYQAEMEAAGRKAVLFVMVDETRNCDLVAEHLRRTYPDLTDSVLTIHTKNNGEISESGGSKSTDELQTLRKASYEIDSAASPYKAVVSVMMLREGWDVQSVCVIVGLRPFNSKAKILPEQTLGRGLRRMFRGDDSLTETLSVIGTEEFINFVDGIKAEGVELDEVAMGPRAPGASNMLIEIDRANPKKIISDLDIAWPVLEQRFERADQGLERIDIGALPAGGLALKAYEPAERREIVFRHIDNDEVSHITDLSDAGPAAPENVIGWFARIIRRDLRLVGQFDVLFGLIKDYVEQRLFARPVSIDDPDVLRALCEPQATAMVLREMKAAVNAVTMIDRGAPIQSGPWMKLSAAAPFFKPRGPFVAATKSVFNKIVGDNAFETELAEFLEAAADVHSFAKNHVRKDFFHVEYVSPRGLIANYWPDFLVQAKSFAEPGDVYIIETKGQEDIDVAPKRARLRQWCRDHNAIPGFDGWHFHPIFIDQAGWETPRGQIKTFADLCSVFGDEAASGHASELASS